MHASTRMIRTSISLTLVAAAMFAGCDRDTAEPGHRAESGAMDSRGGGAAPMPAAMSDGEFAAMMEVHHEVAIDMARVEVTSGQREDVQTLARGIIDGQSKENVELERIARVEGHAEHTSDPAAERQSKMTVDALRAAQGGEVDRAFLKQMIEHHASGVNMTRRSLPNLKRNELRQMAQKMIDDQTREIEQMRGMLNR